jgi:hypothetical protein
MSLFTLSILLAAAKVDPITSTVEFSSNGKLNCLMELPIASAWGASIARARRGDFWTASAN